MSADAASFVLPPQPLLATDIAGFALLTLAAMYAGLWWRDREPGMNWLALFFGAFGLWWATSRWHLPTAERITQPLWLLLPVGGIAALMVGLVRYLDVPAAMRRWLLPALLSLPALTAATMLASLALPISRAYTSPLIGLCVLGCVVLALDARRREPGAGHGIIAVALATLPLVIAGTLLSGADIVMLRYLGPLPLIFFGVVLLAVSLLRRRRAMEAEIERRAQAESALAALNASLEQQVQQRTAELRAARDEADRANAAKSDFLSSMSHELRTPLNAVLGFGQLLQMDVRRPLAPEHHGYVGHMLRAGHHLLTLINEVLDLALLGRVLDKLVAA